MYISHSFELFIKFVPALTTEETLKGGYATRVLGGSHSVLPFTVTFKFVTEEVSRYWPFLREEEEERRRSRRRRRRRGERGLVCCVIDSDREQSALISSGLVSSSLPAGVEGER
jgi:hypothetical protein